LSPVWIWCGNANIPPTTSVRKMCSRYEWRCTCGLQRFKVVINRKLRRRKKSQKTVRWWQIINFLNVRPSHWKQLCEPPWDRVRSLILFYQLICNSALYGWLNLYSMRKWSRTEGIICAAAGTFSEVDIHIFGCFSELFSRRSLGTWSIEANVFNPTPYFISRVLIYVDAMIIIPWSWPSDNEFPGQWKWLLVRQPTSELFLWVDSLT
jgi:hypothetical protein